ncbi:hypothetical protein LOK49_LG04G01492 [Camellia lanceoleosa]|uniref:Uncharacterized protein n=1 Tax=Camellia lanceoleosa TaxID=1840588 RepID=A0ACC0I034_9ERIC|nr:hypothetical protein LOK49_LG04G01492 [Camellia lanceoleosa]
MFIKIHMPYRPWRKEPECWGSEIYSSIVTGWGSSCCLLHYHPLLFSDITQLGGMPPSQYTPQFARDVGFPFRFFLLIITTNREFKSFKAFLMIFSDITQLGGMFRANTPSNCY